VNWLGSLFISMNHMHGFRYIYGVQQLSCLCAVSAACFTARPTTTTSLAYEKH
jgi:hypothetical protein